MAQSLQKAKSLVDEFAATKHLIYPPEFNAIIFRTLASEYNTITVRVFAFWATVIPRTLLASPFTWKINPVGI